MARNKVQFQKGLSEAEFDELYGTEGRCHAELARLRWPDGFACPLEGYNRGEAGKLCGMDRQTLREWFLRYNAEGVAGLCNRIAAGPKPRLTPEQEALVAEMVRKGPDLAVDGVVRWRRVDMARM